MDAALLHVNRDSFVQRWLERERETFVVVLGSSSVVTRRLRVTVAWPRRLARVGRRNGRQR